MSFFRRRDEDPNLSLDVDVTQPYIRSLSHVYSGIPLDADMNVRNSYFRDIYFDQRGFWVRHIALTDDLRAFG